MQDNAAEQPITLAERQMCESIALSKVILDGALVTSGECVPRPGSPWEPQGPDAIRTLARQAVQKWLWNAPAFWYEHGLSEREARSCIAADFEALKPIHPQGTDVENAWVSWDAVKSHPCCPANSATNAAAPKAIRRVKTDDGTPALEFRSAYRWLFGRRELVGSRASAKEREIAYLWRLLFLDADFDDLRHVRITEKIADRKTRSNILPRVCMHPPAALRDFLADLSPAAIRHLQATLVAWYIQLNGDPKPVDGSAATKKQTRMEMYAPTKHKDCPLTALQAWAVQATRSPEEALCWVQHVTPTAKCNECGAVARFTGSDSAVALFSERTEEEKGETEKPQRVDTGFTLLCPRCGRTFDVTLKDLADRRKSASDAFKSLNQTLPLAKRLTPSIYRQFVDEYLNQYRAHGGIFADPRPRHIAAAIGNEPGTVSSSLDKIWSDLGNQDIARGKGIWYDYYLNPLIFAMWFLEKSGLKMLRNVLPTLTSTWTSRFFEQCMSGGFDAARLEDQTDMATMEALFNEAHPPEELGIKDIRDPLWTPAR